MSPSRTAALPLNANAPGLEPSSGSLVGLQAETIILETRQFDLGADDPAPTTVKGKFALGNRLRATMTELAVFHEHYLMLRVRRKGKRTKSALINLRYLDARPSVSGFVAKRMLRTSLALFGGALLAGFLACLSVLPLFSALTAIGLALAGGVSLLLFARWTTETVTFRTAEGRAPALVLHANVGCLRAFRALVPPLSQCVTEARRTVPADRTAYLRREMREHYRLQEIGALSTDACSEGTLRILGKFDSER
jgi:hypothetical protein